MFSFVKASEGTPSAAAAGAGERRAAAAARVPDQNTIDAIRALRVQLRDLHAHKEALLDTRSSLLNQLSRVGRDILGVGVEITTVENAINRLNPRASRDRTSAPARESRTTAATTAVTPTATTLHSPAISILEGYRGYDNRDLREDDALLTDELWSKVDPSIADINFEDTRKLRFKQLDFTMGDRVSSDFDEKDFLQMNTLKTHPSLIGRNIAFGRVDFVFSDRTIEVPLTHEGRRICFMSGAALGTPLPTKGFYLLDDVSSVSLYNISHLHEDKKIIPHLFRFVMGNPAEPHHSFQLFDPTTRAESTTDPKANLLSAFYALFQYGVPTKSFVLSTTSVDDTDFDDALGKDFGERITLSTYPERVRNSYIRKLLAIAASITDADRRDYFHDFGKHVSAADTHAALNYLKAVFYHSEQALAYYLRNHLQDIYRAVTRANFGMDVKPVAIIIRIFTQRDMCWNCHRTMFLLSQRDINLKIAHTEYTELPYAHETTHSIPTIYAVVGQENYGTKGRPDSRTDDLRVFERPPSIPEILRDKTRLFVRMLTK